MSDKLEDRLIQHRRENTIPNDPAVVYSQCTRTREGKGDQRQLCKDPDWVYMERENKRGKRSGPQDRRKKGGE